MLGRLQAAMMCLSFFLVTAAPLPALAHDERPVPPLPVGSGQATATEHARALSEMADTAARDSAKCQSSGAALGSQAYKECRALLEDKMSIENDVPLDRSYARTRGRNLAGTTGIRFNSVYSTEREFRRVFERLANVRMDQNQT